MGSEINSTQLANVYNCVIRWGWIKPWHNKESVYSKIITLYTGWLLLLQRKLALNILCAITVKNKYNEGIDYDVAAGDWENPTCQSQMNCYISTIFGLGFNLWDRNFNFSESYSVEHQRTRGRWRTTGRRTHDACRHTLTGRQRLVHSLVSVDVMTHWRERAYRGAINTITWTENTEHWRDCALIQSK